MEWLTRVPTAFGQEPNHTRISPLLHGEHTQEMLGRGPWCRSSSLGPHANTSSSLAHELGRDEGGRAESAIMAVPMEYPRIVDRAEAFNVILSYRKKFDISSLNKEMTTPQRLVPRLIRRQAQFVSAAE
jgi:hypothetical protein